MTTPAYRFGPFLVERASYRVLRGGAPLAIAPKLLDVLLVLLDHAGELVTKEALLDAAWPDANVTDNALAQAISELRQALGDDPSQPRFIKTVARRGYRFIGALEPVAEAALRRSAPGGATGAIGAAPPDAVPAIPGRAIAVLDFLNVTGDPETAWLAAGIAETVTGDLRALGDFRVVDRRRVLEAMAAAGESMQGVARETGAALVVVGSFQQSAGRIRITARLVDAAGGEALADAKVDGPIDQIFELQDRVVVAFARELGLPVRDSGGSRIGARETSSLEAYRAFTSGWLRVETLDVNELPAAADDFRRAIAIDHRYALAHTGLASAQFAAYEMTRAENHPARELLDEAIDHARHAVALDDGLAEAHAALGFLLVSRWETAEAVAATRRAVALEPGNWRHHFRLGHASWGEARLRAAAATLAHHPGFAFAHFQIAMVHVARGDLGRAEAVLQEGAAVQDRQRSRHERFPALGLHWLLGLVHLAQGDATAAIDDFSRELAVADPNRLYGREYAMHAHLGQGEAFLAAGRPADAIRECESALALYPDHAPTHLALAAACAAGGNSARRTRHLAAADAAIDALERTRPIEALLVRSQRLAADHAGDEAAAVLAELLERVPPGLAGWSVPVDPRLAGVRKTPAFARVAAALAQRAR